MSSPTKSPDPAVITKEINATKRRLQTWKNQLRGREITLERMRDDGAFDDLAGQKHLIDVARAYVLQLEARVARLEREAS